MVDLADIGNQLAFWRGYEAALQTLLLYAVGIAIYSLVIYGLYQNICRKSLLATVKEGEQRHRLKETLRFIALFPLMSFGFFFMLAVSLILLSKAQSIVQMLIISMAVVGGVRITAYVNESASHDLAKTVPLGLLAVVLVEPGYLSLEGWTGKLGNLLQHGDLIWRFFFILVVLEVILRLTHIGYLRWEASRPKKAGEVGSIDAPPPPPHRPLSSSRR